MTERPTSFADLWSQVGPRFLPFADAATTELPLARLLRLSLFQVSVGMALVLLNATLNRVMIVELGLSAGLVSAMIALPLLFAPARVLIGHKSDNHRSVLGWRRVPFIWLGTMLQWAGLGLMPFALLVMTGDGQAPAIVGEAGAALSFLLVGAGLHTTQTTGLALATDVAPEHSRPRVVALLYVMLLLGMVASSLTLGALLADFSHLRLIQVISGTAVVTLLLNVIALWQQEPRQRGFTKKAMAEADNRVSFRDAWGALVANPRAGRLLLSVGLGSAAFSMQDILLEPYGGEVLGLSVGATTVLTALWATGTLAGFTLAARGLARGADACRLAAIGALAGLLAFPAVILSEPFNSPLLFRAGTVLIGFGGGLFAVGTLTAAMALSDPRQGRSGIALGAWGAVQATATGLAIALGGVLRDALIWVGQTGALGPPFAQPSASYLSVYALELVLVFATLAAIGPLVSHAPASDQSTDRKFGLAEFPG
ncbi:BCD family chlorophyll transporter-like MFS transporter [Rhodothalassium salexigens DSM 2132]|uniref:BCD family chlorophyll transporter-like MFS transporter n=1 Tax=Rhodothalassium salexigens DSM 2132 TaxID=1188247 RepID=A0A4R2PM98_RHOSA|nr:BCD family MFS transporter [Rhodothalassium salexigens]MBB4211400.1 BCD family chlorophyll transporter-like MFS transporter [Rhodothalassium salexigens DSM 2132]MBK1637733.1 MFS transporter [Rhodothalassium salexigens DSM 2132]TCP35321.1 BCD family chlorophyll transporter-like MFS transporter [Rhodothalassium salexigens DSM 2132]